ncbi:cytochrome c [Roseisolibacter sp. H3M3-2]|uniref:c-type cytochrome n=1 Tax=Roseisolibacter sp. H3M3-2 TaxID=3031323 RepID=UPI0023D9C590|nr:cytochrome c [Roseisolibacter sp. H3M3-2]MDF1503285.1 cytochrome c [Roseisolibacter sp. H3M3-2]
MRTPRHPALLAAAALAAVASLAAVPHPAPPGAPPTFAEDVAPILFRNCATCHRPGGIGPFSVLDYDTVKARAEDIREAVSTGAMPPWHAEAPHGTFRNDRRLSDADRRTILAWLDGGAKLGDRAKLPPAPTFAGGWEIGTPDAVLTMAEDFVVPARGTIEYQYFEVPTNFTEDKWVQALEIMPGARQVVHHVLVFARPPAAPAVQPAANAPPAPRPRPVLVFDENNDTVDPPRRDTLHAPPRQLGTLVGTTAPGTNVLRFAEGTALRIRAGSTLVFQMHYTAHGHETRDRTSVGFAFAKEPPAEQVLASQFFNGKLVLPPGKKDVMIPSTLGFNEAVRVHGLFPHTHLRGTRWQYTLEKPDGTSEVILDVPRYDFNWQTYYLFATPLEVPAGARIVSRAWYDNSEGNPDNPDAAAEVRWGDQTWEEMQYTGILYSVNSRRLRPR